MNVTAYKMSLGLVGDGMWAQSDESSISPKMAFE